MKRRFMELKESFASIQEWLLREGRCVRCGQPLKEGKKQRQNGIFLVVCTCQGTFIYDPGCDAYRRELVHNSPLNRERGINV